jgi:hypothetical protein
VVPLAFFVLTMLSAPAVSALAVALMALGASGRLIALFSLYYRWSDIVEQLGKWVRSWRGIIVIVTSRVVGVASYVLSKSCTGSKTVVSFPAPTRQNEGYP